ncbi:unnamed protein product [Pleuronectes platessa]|uniref:Uncharacterized protein n=1 Tax=Pleuronectes platessa TaxID=8262 RepID=A0A9N7VWH0_PLEPL|nr:unnamed protein product [Pleuronectes platessa]
MAFAKELLLSCVFMMHVSFVVMQPLDKQSLCKSLVLPLENLRMAKQDYVELIFSRDPPRRYKLGTWNLSEGITFGNKTEEIQASVCAIMDYLGNHLPNITRSLTKQFDPIIANTNWFLHHFKAAVECTVNVTGCERREIETSNLYARKKTCLRILYSSERWVKNFKKHC